MATKLYDYQQKIVNSQVYPSSALFMDMGTGKTLTSLSLFKKSKQPKILILCIVSKKEDWKDDLLKECNIESVVLDKGTKKNIEILTTTKCNGVVVNFESAWRLGKTLLEWVDKNTYIIVDESSKIKTHSSKIGKFCMKLKDRTKTKCILSGTPQSQGYIDYYNQLAFIDFWNMSYKEFCNTFCIYETEQYGGMPFKKLVGYKHTDELDRFLNDYCVFFKRDIKNKDLPTDIDVKLPKPKFYESFKKIRVYDEYEADNVSKLFVSLRKLCSGNIDKYNLNTLKLDWLKDLCEDLNTRLVIFYNFNFERDMIVDLMKKLKIPYSLYNGQVKDLSNFKKYNNGVAICQYISTSMGINDLVLSHVCVMYSPTTNYIDYAQSKKRIDRIGQTEKPLFYNLYCKGTVEEKILETIKKGKNFDDSLFNKYLEEHK